MGIAINTIGGPLVLLEDTGPVGHWLDVSLKGFQAGAVLTATLPNGRTVGAGTPRRAAATSPRKIRGHTSASATQTRIAKLTIHWPEGQMTHLTNIPADQIITLTPPRR